MLRSVRLLRVTCARLLKLSVVNSAQDCTSSDVRAGAACNASASHLGARGDDSREELAEEEKQSARRCERDGSVSSRGCAANCVQPLKLMQLRDENACARACSSGALSAMPRSDTSHTPLYCGRASSRSNAGRWLAVIIERCVRSSSSTLR